MKQKILLLSMAATIGLVVFLTGKVMPHYSSVILLFIFTTLYTWLVTLAMVHKKRMESKRPKPINEDYQPTVSLVIAAHNEEAVIEQTVRELMRLDYPHYELLVMDDRSDDKTPEILQRLAGELGPRFRYHRRAQDAHPGKPAALNEALTLTASDVIAVFDADAYVAPDFLRRIVPFLADENVGAVQARKVIANADENWLTRCQNYEYSLDSHAQYGRDTIRGAVELRGNGQLVKREALEELGGWNPATLTDDLDLSTRLHIAGWDIRFAHKVCVYEEGIPRFGALLKQRRRWTEGALFRYLEHAGPLVRSRDVSMRTTLDMVAYFLEFMIPLWVVLDLVQLGLGFIVGDPTPARILSSLFVLPVATVGIVIAMVVAIIRFHRPPVGHALLWGIITGCYMALLWTPLVFGIMVKVLFQKKRRTRWDKTEHTGVAHKKMAAPAALSQAQQGTMAS
ncbi:MAG TPA: glycosyltransferase family 2 protein [Oculatellaceae cyanobacterium]